MPDRPSSLTPQSLIRRGRTRSRTAAQAAHRVRDFLRTQNGVTAVETGPAPGGDRVLATVWVEDTPCGLPRRTLPDGTPLYELNGYETDYLYQEIFQDRVYAPVGLRMPARPVILDIGANIGVCSLFLTRAHPGATVYAFEPSPDAFTALAANVLALGLPVVALPWAVGGAAGTAAMTVYPGATVYSGLHAEDAADHAAISAAIDTAVDTGTRAGTQVAGELAGERMRGARTAGVTVIALRDVLDRLGGADVDLLKLDAEGAEADILGSLVARDWSRIRQIIMEVHRESEVANLVALLTDAGYDCAVETVSALRGTGYHNVLAVRRDSAVPQPPRGTAVTPAAGAPALVTVVPPGPHDRLRQALDDFLGADDPPVELETRRGTPATPATGAAPVPSRPADPEVLAVIVAACSDVLGTPVAAGDDFFAAGGTSLTAVRLLARVRERLGGALGLADLMEDPTPAGLAARATTTPRPRP
ncbi:FkbM family methyltransferase [Streptomyces yaizuensis]|uniref:FkbM family methyltransferase n=1 Tax=Streptomyces yaizuensis TaxID=2989713 RepID=A0ABQ5NS61_9ACTN|nr:FkbM family methyltransferase [Streptomyces sp. YSPA8]GLF93213.1 FkbM family methyltransferase [Streptomyces sp. YSPA8]